MERDRNGAKPDCVIIGGYGKVGRYVVSYLQPKETYGRLYLVGRNPEKASDLVRAHDNVEAVRFDSACPESLTPHLRGAPDIVNCTDLPDVKLLRLLADEGLCFVDLSAKATFWTQAKALHEEVKRKETKVLLGAGLIPGLSNVFAKAAYEVLGDDASYHSSVSLSLFDKHGTAAVLHMLDELTTSQAYLTHRKLTFVSEGERRVYSFPFPEAQFYPQTLKAAQASTWLELRPTPLNSVVRWLKAISAFRSLSDGGRAFVEHALTLMQPFTSEAETALTVNASKGDGHCTYSLYGKGEARLTALVAVLMLEQFRTTPHRGVVLPEEVIGASDLFASLRRSGSDLRLSIEEARGTRAADNKIARPEKSLNTATSF